MSMFISAVMIEVDEILYIVVRTNVFNRFFTPDDADSNDLKNWPAGLFQIFCSYTVLIDVTCM